MFHPKSCCGFRSSLDRRLVLKFFFGGKPNEYTNELHEMVVELELPELRPISTCRLSAVRVLRNNPVR